MKKILLSLLFIAQILYAQIGIGQDMEGVRVPTANTLSQGYFFISGSYEAISDGHALAMNGYTIDDGSDITSLDKNTPSSGGSLSLGFGATDNLELSLMLPSTTRAPSTVRNLTVSAQATCMRESSIPTPFRAFRSISRS